MEHITVKQLSNGYFKLIPEEGYKLYNTITQMYHSVAVVKDIKPYVAVKV